MATMERGAPSNAKQTTEHRTKHQYTTMGDGIGNSTLHSTRREDSGSHTCVADWGGILCEWKKKKKNVQECHQFTIQGGLGLKQNPSTLHQSPSHTIDQNTGC